MMPGTRISPEAAMRQAWSDLRSSKPRSMSNIPSNVDDALSEPAPFGQLLDAQARERRPLDLDAGRVPGKIHALAVRHGLKLAAFDLHVVPAEEHAAGRHLVDDGVQEIDEEQLDVRGVAADVRGVVRSDALRIGDRGRQRERRLLEGFGKRCPDAADADVGAVRKVLVACFVHRREHGKRRRVEPDARHVPRGAAYEALTSMRFACSCACCVFGRSIVRTPLRYVAETLSASTSAGSSIWRRKYPYARSRRWTSFSLISFSSFFSPLIVNVRSLSVTSTSFSSMPGRSTVT